MSERPTCDYYDCDSLVCKKDMELTPPTKRYCQNHSDEIEQIINEEGAAAMLGWWVKSYGGAGKAAKMMLGEE